MSYAGAVVAIRKKKNKSGIKKSRLFILIGIAFVIFVLLYVYFNII